MEILWYRVISASSPRVAAQKPSYREVEPLERPVLSECFKRILGACGGESAGGRFQRADADLIESDQHDEREYSNFFELLLQAICPHPCLSFVIVS